MPSALTTTAQKALHMIVTDLVHLPGGYRFWQDLPSKGTKSQKRTVKRWVGIVLRTLYPVQLRQAALLACLNDQGVPDDRSRALYSWMVKVVYQGNAQQMHGDWYRLKESIAKQPGLLFKPAVKVKRNIVRPFAMQRHGMGTWHEYPPVKSTTLSTVATEKVS